MSKYYSEEAIKDVIRKIETEDLPIGLGVNPRTWCVMLLKELQTIEANEDAISRQGIIESFLADNECKREEAEACMCSLDLMLELIEDAPSIIPERPEIIRCKNCIHDNNCEIQYAAQAESKFFCSAAESKTEPKRPEGEWIEYISNENGARYCRCTSCDLSTVNAVTYDSTGQRHITDFCPNCGADMRGEKK